MRADLKNTQKDVYLMRGLPGMGKSTIANQLYKSIGLGGGLSVICSADHYFIDIEDGVYKFDKTKLYTAHKACQTRFTNAIDHGYNIIVVDCTHIRRADFYFYEKAAKEAGYRFFEITVGNLDTEASFTRNAHSVPMESIKRMAERWER